jgi:hypothetical protein
MMYQLTEIAAQPLACDPFDLLKTIQSAIALHQPSA